MADDSRPLPERAESLLAELPMPEHDWDAQALAIERRIQDEKLGTTPAALLDPPVFAPEPGEPAEAKPSSGVAAAVPPPSSTSLAELARSLAPKAARAESSALARETLSVAAAARAQPQLLRARLPEVRANEEPRRTAAPSAPAATQAPASAQAPASPAQPPASAPVAPDSKFALGPFLAGAAVALAAAAVAVLLVREPPREPVAAQPPMVIAAPTPTTPPPSTDTRRAEQTTEQAPPRSETAPELAAASPKEDPQPPASARSRSAGTAPAPASSPERVAQTKPLEAPARSSTTAHSPPPEHVVLEESPAPSGPATGMRPASGTSNKVPDKPSPGAVQAALGSVLGAARACIAGSNGPSTANVIFNSTGAVERVTVTGPAAGTPAATCIQSALRRARVAPFAQPSYVISGLSIRP